MTDQSLGDAAEVAKQLELFLTTETVYQNVAPAKFDESLEQVCTSTSREDIAKIFLKAGFPAWFAYFLATEKRLVQSDDIIQLASGNLVTIAVVLSTTRPHVSISTLFKHLFWTSKRAPTRRRLLSQAGVAIPESAHHQEATLKNPRTQKRRRTNTTLDSPNPRDSNILNFMAAPSTGELRYAQIADIRPTQVQNYMGTVSHSSASQECWTGMNGSTTRGAIDSTDTDPSRTHFDIDKKFQQAWPPARNIPLIFTGKIGPYIVRQNSKASFMASFPSEPSKCCFYVDVSADQVQDIVKDFFGVKIDIVNQKRYLIHASGASQKIKEPIRLKRVRPELVETFFSTSVHFAFSSSLPRLQEVDQGIHLTRAISIEIAGDSRIPGRFQVKTNAEQLKIITNQLWQNLI